MIFFRTGWPRQTSGPSNNRKGSNQVSEFYKKKINNSLLGFITDKNEGDDSVNTEDIIIITSYVLSFIVLLW